MMITDRGSGCDGEVVLQKILKMRLEEVIINHVHSKGGIPVRIDVCLVTGKEGSGASGNC